MLKQIREDLIRSGIDPESITDPALKQFLVVVEERYRSDVCDQNSKLLSALLDAIPGYVSWVSSDLRYLGVNCRLAETFHLTPQDFVGKDVGFLGQGTELDDFLKNFFESEVQKDAVLADQEFGVGAKSVWHLFVAQKYDDGRSAVVVGIDLTEMVKSQTMIQEQSKAIAENARLAALGQMAAGIAHEINNPLAVLLTRNRLLKKWLQRDEPDSTKIIEGLDNIEDMAERISKIVKSCKRFSRSAGNDPFEHTSLNSVISDTVSVCRGQVLRHGIRFNVEDISDDLFIECRPSEIGQVMMNLISNAADELQNEKAAWIDVRVSDCDETVEIRVVDSGNGVPTDIQDKMFNPFFTTKPPGRGTGLGLSICSGIVKDHGGTLSIDNSSANTCFVVTLPKVQTPNSSN